MQGTQNKRLSTSTIHQRRPFTKRAILGVFVISAVFCCGALIWPTLQATAAELADLAIGVVILAVTITGHALTTWWAAVTKPHWSRWALSQAPYPTMYLLLYLWYVHQWTPASGGPSSLWYLPWAGLAMVAMSWLWLWWHDFGDRTNPRRAIAFLSALIVLLAGNGIGVALVGFRHTEGFGLKGFPTTWQAWDATVAASCIGNDHYVSSTGSRIANCPRDSAHTINAYDATLFRRATCNHHEVIKPFKRWHDLKRDTQSSGFWKWHKESETNNGDTAALLGRMRTEHFGAWRGPEKVKLSAFEETWHITLNKPALNGWKVCHIEVKNPITVTPLTEAPSTPTPSATPSTPPTPSPAPSWRQWDNRVSWWCSDDAGPLKRSDCPSPPADWTQPGPWECAPDYRSARSKQRTGAVPKAGNVS